MISTYFRESTPSMKIMLTLMFCLTGMLLFMFIGMLIVFALYGPTAMTYLSNPNPIAHEAIASLKILQICQAIGLFIVPGFLLSIYFSSKPKDYLGFKKININLGFLTALTVLFAYPAINLLASLNEQINLPEWMNGMEEKAQMLTKAFMQVNSFGGVLVNIFMIAILPAIGEELIFRGILQRLFSELTGKTLWGIIISAALFSAMHLQFQGFIPRFALGVLFGYLLVWSGSLWLPIIAHFINNSIAIIGYTLIYKGNLPAEAENVGGLTVLWPLGVISLIAVLAFLMRIKSEGLMIRKIE
ncbi:MAG: CPBP family intramembrane metalloprotease [Bacteroidales bacterium]|nr:CPBP family intramembrane metalloprotease [Bacteroidales bacterium]